MAGIEIPVHTGCRNCGECCGPVPVYGDDIDEIIKFLAANPQIRIKAKNRLGKKMKCAYRDDKHKKCLIYPVRPILCRLMGVVCGMECAYGNTFNFDSRDLGLVVPDRFILVNMINAVLGK